MKRPGIIFFFLSIYIVVAFGWWTIAHIKSSRLLFEEQVNALELLCYKANAECRKFIRHEPAGDTTQLKAFLLSNFPELQITFTQHSPITQGYIINPKPDTYLQLKTKYKRKVLMYSLEGAVMVLLLFWGIVWIYKMLLSRLHLNRMQNNFLLSITHELKTPLTSVKLYLETLLKRQLNKEQSDTIVSNSINDINRLRDLVDNILMAAQLDSKRFQLQNFEINISHALEETIEKYIVPRNISHKVKTDIQHDVFIQTDKMALDIVVTNLLSNAQKYSEAESPITVSLTEHPTHIKLAIADSGYGISEQDKKNLFHKFFRAGDEQTRKSKGTGLGLFIVKNLIHLMNGIIEVKNNHPKGTIFEITLKK